MLWKSRLQDVHLTPKTNALCPSASSAGIFFPKVLPFLHFGVTLDTSHNRTVMQDLTTVSFLRHKCSKLLLLTEQHAVEGVVRPAQHHRMNCSCRKWDSQLDSILQMCKTVFILIVLGGGALLFSADANRLVLIPVDRMVQRVKNMADNPRSFSKVLSLLFSFRTFHCVFLFWQTAHDYMHGS